MSGDLDKINEIFRIHDEKNAENEEAKTEAPAGKGKSSWPLKKKVAQAGDKADETAADGDREDRPAVSLRREYRSGCLGGIMYFVFIICLSVVLACLAWMAASDMLALNKEDFVATVNLPSSIFESKTIDTYDEDGNKTGTERVTSADVGYVAEALKEAGLIEYKWLFETFCKISNADRKVSPGEYELKSTFDYRALIQNMRSGSDSALTVDVTIPEGFSMYQIFKRLDENDVCSYEDLMDAAANYKFNYSFLEGLEEGDASRLEGFLFPDTYQFYVGEQASSVINKFLMVFYNKLTADMTKQAQDKGMTIKQIVTIASMIEKEAANDEERGLIASVIYNRLNAGMPLGIDATILYLYPEHEGSPTGEMLEVDSGYNTRLYTGLPPTPISNPGIASINAALMPESTDYYYYALDTATGTHRFFTNAAEHESFVATQNYE